MKKILSIAVLASVLVVAAAPVAVLAADAPSQVTQCTMRHDLQGQDWEGYGFVCPAKGSACPFDDTTVTCANCCLLDTIYTITDWIFIIVMAIAVIMIIFGAFNIITAGGDAAKVGTGRSYILWAAIGVIVAAAAKIIPTIARSVLGL